MRSKVAERILANSPEEVKIFAKLYGDLIVRINSILNEKGYTQKELAHKLEKNPSEIHKWLSSEHNFTLRSIAKLQAELGETLLEVPSKKTTATLYSPFHKASYRLTVKRNPLTVKGKKEEWINANVQNEYANVG